MTTVPTAPQLPTVSADDVDLSDIEFWLGDRTEREAGFKA